jgi:hypothetical protein
MAPRISLITAVFVAALAVCVPAALADDGSQTTFNGSPDAVDRAIAAQQQSQTTFNGSPDAIDRAIAAQRQSETTFNGSPDAIDRAIATQRPSQTTFNGSPDAIDRAIASERARVDAVVGGRVYQDDNRFQLETTGRPTTVSVSSSGNEIEWPQVGIGFAVGIALALGLLLTLRATRQGPLAH